MHSSTVQLVNNASCKVFWPQGSLCLLQSWLHALLHMCCARELTKLIIVVCGASALPTSCRGFIDTRGAGSSGDPIPTCTPVSTSGCSVVVCHEWWSGLCPVMLCSCVSGRPPTVRCPYHTTHWMVWCGGSEGQWCRPQTWCTLSGTPVCSHGGDQGHVGCLRRRGSIVMVLATVDEWVSAREVKSVYCSVCCRWWKTLIAHLVAHNKSVILGSHKKVDQ